LSPKGATHLQSEKQPVRFFVGSRGWPFVVKEAAGPDKVAIATAIKSGQPGGYRVINFIIRPAGVALS
jgi:hypothetical protein